MRIKAAVLREHDGPFRIEDVELADPLPGEVRVAIAGVGLCHTDEVVRLPALGLLPLIAGHEGAGVVDAVGPGVTDVRVGDHVVLAPDSCGDCVNCQAAHPAYCTVPAGPNTFALRNMTGRRLDGTTSVHDADGGEVAARWFQQSSFASHTVVAARNVVVVDPEVPVELLGPLGCSVLTGAGSVFNALNVQPGTGFAVFGAGAVGLSAVMAAQVAGAGTIVAVDRLPQRLELAKELGATHVVLADEDTDLAAEVVAATGGGAQSIVDTTGSPRVISAAIASLRLTGVLGLVAFQQGDVAIGPTDLAAGRTVTGIVLGDAVHRELVPRLIELRRQGRFPFDRLITKYPLADINDAEQAVQAGTVVKPVLLP
ncbi:NAD(P)-dependent alcohol dehydrogenase [Lentzea sp. NPDC051838]|uniref:NAD(P)-dependent alcohol dehydrogenase n=1 Tax=Lentzea sp. NPDC051838 TaxID=3154849 RepID=UPI00343C409B